MCEHVRAILLAVCCFVTVPPASAGPPLLSDDPHTVGPGVLQVILAASAFQLQDITALQAPVIDLTLGLVDGLDLILTAGPTHNLGDDVDIDLDGNLLGAVKWQFLDRDRWNASFTPGFGVDLVSGGQPVFLFPVQLEYTSERLAIGTDAGYAVVTGAPDQWLANLYATAGPWRNVTLMGELWTIALPSGAIELGMNAGVDWEIPFGLHVLAAGGTGVWASRGERTSWTAFLGIQRDFTLWKPRLSGR